MKTSKKIVRFFKIRSEIVAFSANRHCNTSKIMSKMLNSINKPMILLVDQEYLMPIHCKAKNKQLTTQNNEIFFAEFKYFSCSKTNKFRIDFFLILNLKAKNAKSKITAPISKLLLLFNDQ